MGIPQDKIAHLLAGIAIAAIASPFGLTASIIAVSAAAVGKELWDAQGHGTPDKYDALATIAGGALLMGWFAAFPLLTK